VGRRVERQPEALAANLPDGRWVESNAVLEVEDSVLNLGVTAVVGFHLEHRALRLGTKRSDGSAAARRECLDWMLIVSERHLSAVLREYWAHYNHERPHRSRGLRPPASRGDPAAMPRLGTTNRRERLGDLLGEYYPAHEAA
jgi:hypothetical protein